MKSIIKPIFFLTIILLFVGCKKETYNLNDEFTLAFNKSAIVKIDGMEYKIKFTNLEEDSRCPPDVYCFWMGQVAVKINLNNDTDFIIGHHLKIPSAAKYKNLTIGLLEVSYDKKKNFGEEKLWRRKTLFDKTTNSLENKLRIMQFAKNI